MKRLLELLFLLACGCGGAHHAAEVVPHQPKQLMVANDTQRFTVMSYGEFRAGFEGNIREIVIVTDTETGHKYIGITGVGITELRSETETTTSVDAEGNIKADTVRRTKER